MNILYDHQIFMLQEYGGISRYFHELIANLNKKHNSFEWWGGELASRNTATTPLLHNITYLFSVKKILASFREKRSNKRIPIFSIIDSDDDLDAITKNSKWRDTLY